MLRSQDPLITGVGGWGTEVLEVSLSTCPTQLRKRAVVLSDRHAVRGLLGSSPPGVQPGSATLDRWCCLNGTPLRSQLTLT